uniref:Pc3 n=1 Tax=Tenuivirus oryzabrevis TaxID=3052762 RepID=A0A0R5NCX8_9VIRU|nr:Pc3 [Tenuivirus oryzabrevis]
MFSLSDFLSEIGNVIREVEDKDNKEYEDQIREIQNLHRDMNHVELKASENIKKACPEFTETEANLNSNNTIIDLKDDALTEHKEIVWKIDNDESVEVFKDTVKEMEFKNKDDELIISFTLDLDQNVCNGSSDCNVSNSKKSENEENFLETYTEMIPPIDTSDCYHINEILNNGTYEKIAIFSNPITINLDDGRKLIKVTIEDENIKKKVEASVKEITCIPIYKLGNGGDHDSVISNCMSMDGVIKKLTETLIIYCSLDDVFSWLILKSVPND